jgi:hypothetical protein
VNAELPTEGNDDERWVAENLHKIGIELHDDVRYRLHYGFILGQTQRPLRAPHRPLRPPENVNMVYPGQFSWCIFMEGNSGSRIPLQFKIQEFKKVFAVSRTTPQE